MRVSERLFNHGFVLLTVGVAIYPEARIPGLVAVSIGGPLIAEYSGELLAKGVVQGAEIGSNRIKALSKKIFR